MVWRCNKKYATKGEKSCESKHIADRVLYKVFTNTFNAMIENKNYFFEKWKLRIGDGDVLVRYKSKQFTKILEGAEMIEEFDMNLFF